MSANEVLACIPVDAEARFGIAYTPCPGSVIIDCPGCKEKIWIGPKQQEKAKEGCPVLCAVCLVRRGDLKPGAKIFKLRDD